MSSKSKMVKARHTSLEMVDPEIVVKKKQDVMSKARHKFFHFGENKIPKEENPRKSVTQSTLEYLFKPSGHGKHPKENIQNIKFLKQASLVDNPKIEIEEYDDFTTTISRNRPATVCTDKVSENRETDALALERPRKKLSFREPEYNYVQNMNGELRKRKPDTNSLNLPAAPGMKRSLSFTNGVIDRTSRLMESLPISNIRTVSDDNFELESQAMRVVRTVGQAFEVCHKLSITAPENENNLDPDEQDTLTQDLLSDRLSDITNDKTKKDFLSDCEKISLPPDDIMSSHNLPLETNYCRNFRSSQVDLLPPPPHSNNSKKLTLISSETYSSPHSDTLTSGNGSGGCSLPPPGSALSAHHEIQLLREQLEQQNQQIQATLAQFQLAKEQLAAEQSARMEAQARTHQLLVHNRELLDHIAALVSHLQNGEQTGQQPPHVTLPQQQGFSSLEDTYLSELSNTLDKHTSVQQGRSLNAPGLIENRAVTGCLPSSPLRNSLNSSSGTYFNFPYSPEVPSYDSQFLQRLQALSNFNSPSAFGYNYPQTLPFFQPTYFPQPMMSNYNLPTAPKKYQTLPRQSYHDPINETRFGAGRNSEPRQMPYQNFANNLYSSQSLSQLNQNQTLQNLDQNQNPVPNQNLAFAQSHNPKVFCTEIPSKLNQTIPAQQNLQQGQNTSKSFLQNNENAHFIKPLPQMGTLTTTDSDGRVRVIVPVPAGRNSNPTTSTEKLLTNLRLTDELKPGPPPTRTASEKVPNRSELMAQMQRTVWARHTTK